MRFVSPNRSVAYVVIPKTGCTSVTHALREAGFLSRCRGRLPQVYADGPGEFDPGWGSPDGCALVAVIRDPLERLLSEYKYLRSTQWRRVPLTAHPALHEYVLAGDLSGRGHQASHHACHFHTQTEFLGDGPCTLVDFRRLADLPGVLAEHGCAVEAIPRMNACGSEFTDDTLRLHGASLAWFENRFAADRALYKKNCRGRRGV